MLAARSHVNHAHINSQQACCVFCECNAECNAAVRLAVAARLCAGNVTHLDDGPRTGRCCTFSLMSATYPLIAS
jgi:hypothetical protein